VTGRARAEATLSEADWQRWVMDLARLHRWRVAHYRPAPTKSGRYATPVSGHVGAPDLILARDGVVLLAELKREGGKTSPDQDEWLRHLGQHGRLWRPSDRDDVLEALS